jgi:hypothetical protein
VGAVGAIAMLAGVLPYSPACCHSGFHQPSLPDSLRGAA